MTATNGIDLTFKDKTLGRYLKLKREERGLTQSFVAEKLGYTSSQFISNIERGISNVPIKSLKILIDLYRLPADEVIDILLSERRSFLMSQLGLQATAVAAPPPPEPMADII